MIALSFQQEELVAVLFLLARCSGLFVFTPFLGSANIPIHIRVILSFAVSYLFAMSYRPPIISGTWTLTSLLIGVAGELLVGMVIGFAAYVLFAGLQFAGQLIGFQIGLSLVNTIDPQSSSRSGSLSVYQNHLGMMLFLGLNGHHWFIRAISSSLTVVPPYSVSFNAGLMDRLVGLSGQLFIIGFQVAAPVTAVLILTDFVLGMVGRTAPQLHILMIGFPIKILAGISALGIALYYFPAAMRAYSAGLVRDMDSLIHLMAR
jgi:flagellar biosynthetic protein FliR